MFGGQRIDFIAHFATQAIRLMEDPANQRAMQSIGDKIGHSLLFEQYLLGACIEYHRGRATSPYRDISIEYVFASSNHAFDPAIAAQVGFTHLIAHAKRNPDVANRLESRVARECPSLYERAVEYFAQPTGLG